MNAYIKLAKQYKNVRLLPKMKICGTDTRGKRFTIHTNVEQAEHYNIFKGNFWQRVEVTQKHKTFEKWALISQVDNR